MAPTWATTDQARPSVNTRVQLLPQGHERWLPSRVEDTGGDTLVVATPTNERGLNIVLRPGEEVVLFWPTASGPNELRTAFVSATTGMLSLWTLRPTGEARRMNRRAFFRVPLAAPVRIAEPDPGTDGHGDGTGADGEGAEGGGEHGRGRVERPATLIDLSEGGLRCHLREPAPVDPGDALEVTIDLDTGTLSLTATVVRSQEHDLGQEVCLSFRDVPDADADRIRRRLFDEQRRLRVLGLL